MTEKLKFRCFDTSRVTEEIANVHSLVSGDLSEPYTIAIYYYFMLNWPDLAIFAYVDGNPNEFVGVIVGGLRNHQQRKLRGYIAMLAVKEEFRGRGIAKQLISEQIEAFKQHGADEVVLEAECKNKAGISLYEGQGFIRTRRMSRYYFGMNDAFRLVLPLTEKALKTTVFLNPTETEELETY